MFENDAAGVPRVAMGSRPSTAADERASELVRDLVSPRWEALCSPRRRTQALCASTALAAWRGEDATRVLHRYRLSTPMPLTALMFEYSTLPSLDALLDDRRDSQSSSADEHAERTKRACHVSSSDQSRLASVLRAAAESKTVAVRLQREARARGIRDAVSNPGSAREKRSTGRLSRSSSPDDEGVVWLSHGRSQVFSASEYRSQPLSATR